MSKIAKSCLFFKWPLANFLAICLKKMKIFGNLKKKKVNFFGNFLTVKWQFSGGSDPHCKLIHLFCVCWIDMVWQILIIFSSMYSVHLRLYNLIVFKASLNPTKLKFSAHLKVSLSSVHRFCICETGVTKRNFYDSSIDIQIRSLTMIYELLCWYNINTVVLQNLF